jgi:hypothetical protein
MTEAAGNVWGGVLEGAGSGIGKVGAAMMESDTAENLYDKELKAEQNRIDRNLPGTTLKTSPVISLPPRWEALTDISSSLTKYKQPLDQGLLVKAA